MLFFEQFILDFIQNRASCFYKIVLIKRIKVVIEVLEYKESYLTNSAGSVDISSVSEAQAIWEQGTIITTITWFAASHIM